MVLDSVQWALAEDFVTCKCDSLLLGLSLLPTHGMKASTSSRCCSLPSLEGSQLVDVAPVDVHTILVSMCGGWILRSFFSLEPVQAHAVQHRSGLIIYVE